MAREKPHCSKRTVLASSALFTIEQMHLHFANGENRVYERIRSHGHGAVLIVPLTANNTMLLIREYAAGIDDYELSFPKGVVSRGEELLVAANRELQEEVGVAAEKLTMLKSMTLAPGYFGARLDLVVAQGLYSSRLPGDEPEPPEVVEWSLNASEQLLARSDFSESRSIAALLLVKNWLKKE